MAPECVHMVTENKTRRKPTNSSPETTKIDFLTVLKGNMRVQVSLCRSEGVSNIMEAPKKNEIVSFVCTYVSGYDFCFLVLVAAFVPWFMTTSI